MFRTVHALLLILALIACPYRCGGAMACNSVQATHSCPCCKHRRPPREGGQASNAAGKQRVPAAPENDCHCDCLCRGAVLSDDEAVKSASITSELFLVPELPSQISVAGDSKSAAEPADSPPRCSCSAGRHLRLAIQSLQI